MASLSLTRSFDRARAERLALGIQLGLIGIAVLCAMWVVHLLTFRGAALATSGGLLMVVQSVISSAFNSHLFDFVQDWTFVVEVGVAGGMVLRARRAKPA